MGARSMRWCALVAFGVALAACDDDDDEGLASFPGEVSQVDALDDAQIVGVLRSINDTEIELSRRALQFSDDVGVRELARLMRAEHAQANEELFLLAEREHLSLADSEVRQDLLTFASGLLADLLNAAGEAVGVVYVRTQVDMHSHALQLIDEELAPEVEDAELLAYVRVVRVAVYAHLAASCTRWPLTRPPLTDENRGVGQNAMADAICASYAVPSGGPTHE